MRVEKVYWWITLIVLRQYSKLSEFSLYFSTENARKAIEVSRPTRGLAEYQKIQVENFSITLTAQSCLDTKHPYRVLTQVIIYQLHLLKNDTARIIVSKIYIPRELWTCWDKFQQKNDLHFLSKSRYEIRNFFLHLLYSHIAVSQQESCVAISETN